MPTTKHRRTAIDRLGGIYCAGLSFIGGPECPVPKELLTLDDINIGHRVGMSGEARRIGGGSGSYYLKIAEMKQPEKKYINLCTLCNQRMRHLAKEYRYTEIPKRAITLYVKHKWTQEQIAEEYNCCYRSVANFLKRNGVEIKPRGSEGGRLAWGNPLSRKRLSAERRTRYLTPARIGIAKQMSRMFDEGDSFREIAQWFMTTHAVVTAHLKMIGEY